MSLQALQHVLALRTDPAGRPLEPTEKLVLVALANRHNPDLSAAWPSLSLLAQDACISRRWAAKVLANLEERGLIVRRRRPRGSGHTSTAYQFPGLDLPPARLGSEPAFTSDGEPQITTRAAGSEPEITTVVNSRSLPSEPQITTVVNSSSPDPKENRQRTRNGTGRHPASDDVGSPKETGGTRWSEDARTMATAIYDALRARGALPRSKGYWAAQATAAQQVLDADAGRRDAPTLSEWLDCLHWGLDQPWLARRCTSWKSIADKVWPEYRLAGSAQRNGRLQGGTHGRTEQRRRVLTA